MRGRLQRLGVIREANGMVIVLEVTPQPVGPEIPEPSAPSEPAPGQGPEVPSPDPRGPEVPDQPIDPDPPIPSQPADFAFAHRRSIRPWEHRRRAPCAPMPPRRR